MGADGRPVRSFLRPGSSGSTRPKPLQLSRPGSAVGGPAPSVTSVRSSSVATLSRGVMFKGVPSDKRPLSRKMAAEAKANAMTEARCPHRLSRAYSSGALPNHEDEVRELGFDKPGANAGMATSTQVSGHDFLMSSLKSSKAKVQAEGLRDFFVTYKMSHALNKDVEARMDKHMKFTEKKFEDARSSIEELRHEVSKAERLVENLNAINPTDKQDMAATMQGMTAFERSQMQINEAKKEEELQQQRAEAQNNYNKIHRLLAAELVELRDCRVLLAEMRRLKLDKLEHNLSRAADGRKLRSIVREIIKQGGQRVLHLIESTVGLEPWMCEVLVNCCHLEIQIEDAHQKLIPLQKAALSPVRNQVERMMSLPLDARFKRLCTWTWDHLQDVGRSDGTLSGEGFQNPWRDRAQLNMMAVNDESTPASKTQEEEDDEAEADEALAPTRRPDFASDDPEVQNIESELLHLKRLLHETRQNAANAICARIRQDKTLRGRAGVEYCRRMLTILVSQEFAEQATKHMFRNLPQAAMRV